MTLQEFKDRLDEFLAYIDVEKGVSQNTLKSYQLDLGQFIQFWEQIEERDKKPSTFKKSLDRFFISLYHKSINKSSIARKMSCFNSFEKFLLTQGIELNLSLQRPKIDKKLPVFLSIEEISYLLDTINNEDLPTQHPERDRTILELLYATGIRCSELINMKLSDIDFEAKQIRIHGKGNKERIVLYGEKARQQLMRYLEKERVVPKSKNEILLLNNRNEKMSSRAIQRVLEMFRKFLKIERRITPHKIRHTFATHMLNQGVDLRVVQELLGHQSLASTEKYTHVSTPQLMKIYDTLHPIHSMVKKESNDSE